MGAELILTFAPAPKNLSEESKQVMLSRVKALTNAELEAATENAYSCEIADIFDERDPHEGCRAALRDAIETMWTDSNRYMFHMPDGVYGGGPCWVAGGTTWGDSFEEMDQLNLVIGTGLLDVFK